MKILSIETSCDETAIAVLDCQGGSQGAAFKVLGNALYSQAHLHAAYGGVYPTLAKREHQKNLPLLLAEAMEAAENPKIDLIAVTQGPGLEPALWQGIEFAKKLGEEWGVPVAGTDHMEGHIVSALVALDENVYILQPPVFPILGLLISGGHTEFVLMKTWFEYEFVGRTKDDAVGEAFDKVARMLGLPYPGGPEVDAHAARSRARGAKHGIVFPRPMEHDNTCDFSFSGLKTAVLYKLRDMGRLSAEDREHVAEAFEDAARDIIVIKTRRALDKTGARTLAVGGGVSANKEIREGLTKLIANEFPGTTLRYPHKTLTGDNAIMIGMAAYLRHAAGAATNPLIASGTQRLAVIPSPNGPEVS